MKKEIIGQKILELKTKTTSKVERFLMRHLL